MSSRPVIEELPSSSDDESLDFGSADDQSVGSDLAHDPLEDFQTVNADAERQSRDAAAAGEPVDLSNAIDMTEKQEEILEVEQLPEDEMQVVRPIVLRFPSLIEFLLLTIPSFLVVCDDM